MTRLLKTLPLLAALVAAPAFAAEPDPHAGHHPAGGGAAATTSGSVVNADAKSAMRDCKMMEGKMMAGAGEIAAGATDGKMMRDGKGMHCMPATAAAPISASPHDHVHPEVAPK